MVQVPLVALPPKVPVTGIVTGSQTSKSAPALTVATGLTVAVTNLTGPAHVLAVGVIAYVTVPCEALVVLSIWLITDPLPLAAPVTLAVGDAVHWKVVPATF